MKSDKALHNILILIIACLAVVALCFGLFKFKTGKSSDGKSGIEKNYGISHVTTNLDINKDGSQKADGDTADEVVPEYDVLVQNLSDDGYEVETYDTVLDTGVSGKRVYARKDKHIADITYLASEDEAATVFQRYETEYETYYLLAQNEAYVYYFSDHNVFEASGFTSLANNGVQYINHDRY